MKKNVYLFIIVALIASSCSVAKMALNDNLKTDITEMQVSGRHGLFFKQKITFGEYKTTQIKKGWITQSSISFALDFKKAKNKFTFKMEDGTKQKSEVFCLGKAEAKELNGVGWFLSSWTPDLTLSSSEVFSGKIVLGAEENTWDFLLSYKEDLKSEGSYIGYVANKNIEIKIYPTDKLEKGFINDIVGYEFVLNEEVIAAVETINKGRVFLKNNLDKETKFIIANMSTALLLKINLEEQMQKEDDF